MDGSNEVQLTHHTQHPVRFLSAAQNGLLCYGYDGEIYTVKEGQSPQKVNIRIVTDQTETELAHQIRTSGATEIAVSPNGKEVAFVLHGDVFVTSTDYKTTKQITDTPEQERSIDFLQTDGASYMPLNGMVSGKFISLPLPKRKKNYSLMRPALRKNGLRKRKSPLSSPNIAQTVRK